MQANDRGAVLSDVGMLLIRGVVGAVFVFHGAQKLFGLFGGPGLGGFAGFLGSVGVPYPTVNAALAGAAEFFGGWVLVAGVGTRLAAVPLLATMLVAITVVRGHGFDVRNGGIEYPLTLAVILAGIALIGPGRLTAARLVRRPSVRPAGASAVPRQAIAS
jgi:putative oxidoreductase